MKPLDLSSGRCAVIEKAQPSDSRMSRPSNSISAEDVRRLVGFVFKDRTQDRIVLGGSSESQSIR